MRNRRSLARHSFTEHARCFSLSVASLLTTLTSLVKPPIMEALEELVRQRDAQIVELERLNAEKETRINELLSQLDKYKSVLLFAGTPGLPTGVFVAPSALPISRKQQRAWGISAEPPSSHSSRSGNTECDGQPCQKFYKDQGFVY